jgi:hypothetical protein
MLILLTAVNERIGAGFVGAFEDDKVSEILKLPKYVKAFFKRGTNSKRQWGEWGKTS